MSYAIGSLCSGYEGLGAGAAAERGGDARLAWVCDNDPGAAAILAHRYPDVPNLGDLRAAGWGSIGAVDVLACGFPCQPVSGAGKRKGVHDERWIWPDIAAGIGQLGTLPRMLVLENVDRLLSASHGRAMGQVIYSLAALGYVGRYGLYAASDAGAPHRRLRWFCLAWHSSAYDATDPARIGSAAHAERDGLQGNRPAAGQDPGREAAAGVGRGPADGGVTAADAERTGQQGTPGLGSGRGQPAECRPETPGGGRLALLPAPAATLGSNGGLVTDAKGRAGGTLIETISLLKTPTAQLAVNGGSQHPDKRRAGGHGPTLDDQVPWELLPTPTLLDSRGSRNRTANRSPGKTAHSGTTLTDAITLEIEWGKYEPAIRRWERITGMPAPCPVEPGTKGNRRLAPPFPEWMMGLPPGWVTGVPGLTRTQQLRAIGNGVVPQQVAAAVRDLMRPVPRG